MSFYDKGYYLQPCRVMFKTKRGHTTRLGGYGLIERMKAQGRYIAAWSTSTGKLFN
jgi:hypothetical protein